MSRIIHTILVGAAAFLLLTGGCEPDNDNDVGCIAPDCEAACQAQGFEGFVAKKCKNDGVCKCAGAGDDPYGWDEPGGNDTDTTPPDSGAGGDAGA